MIDIQQRLKTIFENQRLIFWYDEDGELKDEFDVIEIDGVNKLLIENNEFSIKRQVLQLQADEKFLIYSPNLAPNDEENWLLDLNIANYLFSADKTSLTLQNLGLGVSFKSFIAEFDKFFNSQKRLESLKDMLDEDEDYKSIALKMMAVSIGCDDNIESIIYRVFENEKHFETLKKQNLSGEFFKAIKEKFSYDGDSLKDFLYKMLQNHFYYHIDKSRCTLNNDARLFVKSWMDSNRYKESFANFSEEVFKALNLNSTMSELEATKLTSCDSYKSCDKVIISYLLQKLHGYSSCLKEMEEIIQKREHTFWYSEYKNIYQALLNASRLFDFVKEATFKIESFEAGIDSYAKYWYKADRYYREYSYYASRAEHIELLKSLSKRIEDIYLNGFLRELNDHWQSYADGYIVSDIANHQQKFYEKTESICHHI